MSLSPFHLPLYVSHFIENASVMYYFYYSEIVCFVILQGKIRLEENNQASFRAVLATSPVCYFYLCTPDCVPQAAISSTKDLTLVMALFIDQQEFIYCISPESCTFNLSFVDKVRSRKYVKNFFSGAPHWPPAALPGDSCHLHCLTFAIGRLGCTSVQKRVMRPAPRGSAEPIWLPGGEYGVPRGPGRLCSARPWKPGWGRPLQQSGAKPCVA